MTSTDKEIATIEQAPSTNIIQVIERAAMDPNVDIDKMERLLGMQERILTKESELAFSRSMSACRANLSARPDRRPGSWWRDGDWT